MIFGSGKIGSSEQILTGKDFSGSMCCEESRTAVEETGLEGVGQHCLREAGERGWIPESCVEEGASEDVGWGGTR